jgi:hypothetical protein
MCKIIWQLRVKLHPFTGPGVDKSQRFRMQALPLHSAQQVIEHLFTATRIGPVAHGIPAVLAIPQ